MIVPKAKRTIFINDQKFYLNIPDLIFTGNRRCGVYDRIYVNILKNNERYHVPLPNIHVDGYVCLENFSSENMETVIDYFFCSSFQIHYDAFCQSFPQITSNIFQKDMEYQSLINKIYKNGSITLKCVILLSKKERSQWKEYSKP